MDTKKITRCGFFTRQPLRQKKGRIKIIINVLFITLGIIILIMHNY